MSEIPQPIENLIAATNRADDAAFVHAFTSDATVIDGGRAFSGRESIARWNETDNIGVGMHFELVSITAVGGESYDVTLSATSRRFSGTGTMRVSLRDDLIAHLVIG